MKSFNEFVMIIKRISKEKNGEEHDVCYEQQVVDRHHVFVSSQASTFLNSVLVALDIDCKIKVKLS